MKIKGGRKIDSEEQNLENMLEHTILCTIAIRALWHPLGLVHFLAPTPRLLQWDSKKQSKAFKTLRFGTFLVDPFGVAHLDLSTANSIPIAKVSPDITVYMNPTFTPPHPEKKDITPWICPFGIVKEVDKSQTATMNVHWVKIVIHDIKITLPFLTTKAMGPGTEFAVPKKSFNMAGKSPMSWDAFEDKYMVVTEPSKKKKRKD